jgi:hypothetical protein
VTRRRSRTRVDVAANEPSVTTTDTVDSADVLGNRDSGMRATPKSSVCTANHHRHHHHGRKLWSHRSNDLKATTTRRTTALTTTTPAVDKKSTDENVRHMS